MRHFVLSGHMYFVIPSALWEYNSFPLVKMNMVVRNGPSSAVLVIKLIFFSQGC